MKFLLVVCLLGVAAMLFQNRIDHAYHRGYVEATRAALQTDPPSEALELVCAGLWVGEQNKKWNLRDKNL